MMRENEDERGIKTSAEYLNSLVQQEIDAGIPADRIVLGGFSQGGAMSIYTGLMSKVKLAGIVSMSGWLLLSKTFREVLNAGPKMNDNTPILMCQGESDPLVKPQLSLLSYQVLNTIGLNVTHKTYPYVASLSSVLPAALLTFDLAVLATLPPSKSWMMSRSS